MGILLSVCPCNKPIEQAQNNEVPLQSKVIEEPPLNQDIKEDEDNNNFIEKEEEVIEDKVIVERKLGEGAFGSLHLGVNRLTGEHRLVQIYHKKKGIDSDRIKPIIKREFKLLKSLNHPNLLKVYALYETPTELTIVNDHSKGKELFELIYTKKALNEEMASLIMYQLLNAVAYFHSNGIFHRDLRTENILLENDTLSGVPRIKIVDVGIAMMTERGRFGNRLSSASFYIAPEVIDEKYNQLCDLWSCGVILYSMLSGRLPFNANNSKELFENIRLGRFDTIKTPFDKVSPEAIDLIKSLIKLQPQERLSAFNALNHPWFNRIQVHKRLSGFNTDSVKYLFATVERNLLMQPLKHDAVAFLIRHLLNIEVVVEARRFVNQLDINHKGYLTKKEFVVGLELLFNKFNGETIQSQSENVFNLIDKNNKGLIASDEFFLLSINPKKLLKESHLREVFDSLIRDKEDHILFEYLKSVISKGRNDFDSYGFTSIAAKLDLSKSGKLTFDEFALLIVQVFNIS